MLFLETLGPFFSTIRFFMENRKQQTWECQEAAFLCCVSAVCSSRFNGRRGVQREVIYGKVFCHPNCPVSTFKGTKQLSVSVCDVLVGCLNSNKRIIPVFWTIEVMHFDSRKNNMSTLNNERLAKIWNPSSVKPWTRNCKLQLLRFVFSHEKPNAKGLYQCCHVK